MPHKVGVQEVDDCRIAFVAADTRLDEIVTPVRRAVGLTDEMIEQVSREMRAEAQERSQEGT